MSKIYEALLRAEQERVFHAAPAAAMPHEWTSTDAPAPRIESTHAAPEPVETSTSASMLAPTGCDSDPQHDVSFVAKAVHEGVDVRTCVWKPEKISLLALGERGAALEQFRGLRSHLFEARDLGPLKTIMVSSGLPEEGKSFVAANLAISLARHKASRVLLIDGDMRRSSLQRVFGCPLEPGLTEYLAEKASLEEVLQQGQTPEGIPLQAGLATLTLIAAGKGGDAAADLSGNERFAQLLQLAAPRFDWIIVDSPPVNLVADGVDLARACDGVLLIARGGVTRYPSLQRAVTELKASKILGVVLNAVTNPNAAGGYYGYDGESHQTDPVYR